jgi:hypothetical protein
MKFEIKVNEDIIKIKEGDILYFPNHYNEMYIIHDIIKSPILSRNGEIKYSLYYSTGVTYKNITLSEMYKYISDYKAKIYNGNTKDIIFSELKENYHLSHHLSLERKVYTHP